MLNRPVPGCCEAAIPEQAAEVTLAKALSDLSPAER